jgi:hypothetical protein
MKLLLTTLLLVMSNEAYTHTGDHQGVWHDHGLIAMMILAAMCFGLFLLSRVNLSGVLARAKSGLNKSILTDRSGEL